MATGSMASGAVGSVVAVGGGAAGGTLAVGGGAGGNAVTSAAQRHRIGRQAWRELARLVLESVAAGAFVSIVLALAVFIVAARAEAAVPADGVAQGTLLFEGDDPAARVAAPLLFTDVHVDVSGLTARVAIRQRFVNPSGDWREGVYVFPLPERAAVDHLDLHVGDRVLEGRIMERAAARRTYDAAKAEGRKATLLDQERPNLFTTRVAHIGPNEEVTVAIEYQERLHFDSGSFRLRLPLAITPRYVPAVAPDAAEARGAGEAGATFAASGEIVTDADRIMPPVAPPGDGAINPVRIDVDLHAGFPLAKLSSPYHPIRIEERAGDRYHVALGDGVVPADRDFELTWTPDVGSAPGASLLTETRDGTTYALLMLLPPAAPDGAPRAPREVTYIIDTSGSMEGVSIQQAKDALLFALDRLQPGDRFNVIEFNSATRALYAAPMPRDPATLAEARRFVAALTARGGTEMKPALAQAMATPRQDALLRQVVFLTDGAVGNENELLALIERDLADRRLFTVGIGPAPNTYFLKKAAEAGRGTFTFIGDVREVREKMSALVKKLESPVLTDVDIAWPAATETHPSRLPDLYAGEPVMLTAALPAGVRATTLALTGKRNGGAWKAALPLDVTAQDPGIGVLFARDRIETLMDAKRNGADEGTVRGKVIETALAFHLVSAYTSLVAVDVTPTASAGIVAETTALPTNLPRGLDHAAIFGGLPRTATPAPLLAAVGSALLLVAATIAVFRSRRAHSRRPAALHRLEAAMAAARRTC